MKNKKISVVVPVFREEDIINQFYTELVKSLAECTYSYEIIFVDDQSDFGTLNMLKIIADKDPAVKIISLSKNCGHQVALTAGIDNALGDAVISMDGDLQHPPALIFELLKYWENGYDIVYTIRKDVKGVSIFKKFSSSLFYYLMSKITDVDMDFNCADFRLMSRKAVEGFKQIRENARFIRGIVGWMGYKKIGVPFVGLERTKGKSKYSLKKLTKFALNGIISFSVVPIRIISVIGMIISLFSFLYIIRILYFVVFNKATLPEWLPLMTIILFVLGIQMVMTGILGEYIAEIFTEAKKRPLYLVDEIYSKEK